MTIDDFSQKLEDAVTAELLLELYIDTRRERDFHLDRMYEKLGIISPVMENVLTEQASVWTDAILEVIEKASAQGGRFMGLLIEYRIREESKNIRKDVRKQSPYLSLDLSALKTALSGQNVPENKRGDSAGSNASVADVSFP